jgi:hypothetical protein
MKQERYYWDNTDTGLELLDTPEPSTTDMDYQQWLSTFGSVWRQGEHVALIGGTGSGKTYVSADLLDFRSFVCCLSIKPHDDTLKRFQKREPRYVTVKTWPPNVQINRCIFKCKPTKLGDRAQAGRVREVLDGIHKAEGWTALLDDVAYIVNTLGLRREVVDLYNVGRSSGITLVGALQQPTSVTANAPSEIKKQTKHTLLWKFTSTPDIQSCADLCGINRADMRRYMNALQFHDGPSDRYTDFLWVRRGYDPVVVRV